MAIVCTLLEAGRIIVSLFDYIIMVSFNPSIVPLTTACISYVGLYLMVILCCISCMAVYINQAISRNSSDQLITLLTSSCIIVIGFGFVFFAINTIGDPFISVIVPHADMTYPVKLYSLSNVGMIVGNPIVLLFSIILFSKKRIMPVLITSILYIVTNCLFDAFILTSINDQASIIALLGISLSLSYAIAGIFCYKLYISKLISDGVIIRDKVIPFIKKLTYNSTSIALMGLCQNIAIASYLKFSIVNGAEANFAYSVAYRVMLIPIMFNISTCRAGGVQIVDAITRNDLKKFYTSTIITVFINLVFNITLGLFITLFRGSFLSALGITDANLDPTTYRYCYEMSLMLPIVMLTVGIEIITLFSLISMESSRISFVITLFIYLCAIPIAYFSNSLWDHGIATMLAMLSASTATSIALLPYAIQQWLSIRNRIIASYIKV